MNPSKRPDHSSPPFVAREPEDLLALAPVVLGFHPEDSAVVLTFGATRQFHARVTLPTDVRDAALPAAQLVHPTAMHGASGVAVLLYAPPGPLAAHVWRHLRRGFRDEGIDIVEALHVYDEHWYSLLGNAAGERGGVRFDLRNHPFMVRAVVEGRVIEPSRSSLVASLHPDPEQCARTAAAAGELAAVPDDDCAWLAEGTWLHDLTVAHLRSGEPFSDTDLARALVAMRTIRLRDAAWAATTHAGSGSAQATHRAVDLWRDVVRRTPDEWLAAPASLLAWSAWQSGSGALAWCAIDVCRRADPDYRLAELIAQALESAVPPTSMHRDWDWAEGLRAS